MPTLPHLQIRTLTEHHARVALPPSAASSFVQAPISEGAPITVIVVQAILSVGESVWTKIRGVSSNPNPRHSEAEHFNTVAISLSSAVRPKNRIPWP
jgi:hypothetical protein